MTIHNKLLITGGSLIFLVALLHIYIAIVGGELYIYFGAGEKYYQLDKSGSDIPMIHTLLIAFFFLGCSLYGVSGFKSLAWLPWQNPVLFIISGIFLLRGLVFFYELVLLILDFQRITLRFSLFSLYALTVGIIYFTGILKLIRYEKTV